jgi:predicted RNase H-like HicB family nuclease
MEYTLRCEQVADGRWLAEVPQLPGVVAYGETRDEALAKAQVLGLRIVAKRIELRRAGAQAVHFTALAAA